MRKHLLSLLLIACLEAAGATGYLAPNPAGLPHQASALPEQCAGYANRNRHRCLTKQLAASTAELGAATSAVRKMMAQWDDTPQRKLAQANFEKTVVDFARYKRTQCEYFASMRHGVADKDEIEIARLECMLRLNAQRTRTFTELTATIIM